LTRASHRALFDGEQIIGLSRRPGRISPLQAQRA
jgi:hypothetical protein